MWKIHNRNFLPQIYKRHWRSAFNKHLDYILIIASLHGMYSPFENETLSSYCAISRKKLPKGKSLVSCKNMSFIAQKAWISRYEK